MDNNYESAVAALKEATNIEQWNAIRSRVARTLSAQQLAKIDSSGLIVEVLGADAPIVRYSED